MPTIRYCDGTKTGGSNNGLTWDTAYEGAVGLQTALDAVVNLADTEIRIRNTFTLTGIINIDAAAGNKATNNWLRIIGYQTNEDLEMPITQHVTLDANGGAHAVIAPGGDSTNLSNIELRHIRFYNTNQAAGTDGIFLQANFGAITNILINACKIEATHSGITPADETVRVSVIDTTITNVTDFGIDVGALGIELFISGCDIQVAAGKICIRVFSGSTITGCILRDGLYGIKLEDDGTYNITNNTFYKQTGSGIYSDDVDTLVNEYNNIHVYAATDDDWYTNNGNGSIGYSDFALTYSAAGTVSNTHGGSNSINNNDPEFRDGDNGDFRLEETSPALNQGKRAEAGFGIGKGFTSIGSWQRKSFLGID